MKEKKKEREKKRDKDRNYKKKRSTLEPDDTAPVNNKKEKILN